MPPESQQTLFLRRLGALAMRYGRWNRFVALLLVTLVLTGCSGSGTTDESLPDVPIASNTDDLVPVGEDAEGMDLVTSEIAGGTGKPGGANDAKTRDEKKGQINFAGYGGPTIYLPKPPETPPPTVAREETYKTTYKDGSPKAERHVRFMSDKTVINHGDYVEFYANGKTFAQGKFDNGAQDGEWKYWFDNGQICKTVTYKRGVADGSWDVFREDGTRHFSRSYSNGRKQGKWVVYAADGEMPVAEENYVDGKAEGLFVQWYPDGQKHTEFPFKNGQRNGTVREWDTDGNLIKEYEFVGGKRHGTSTTWTPDRGKIVQEFREGELLTEPTRNDGAGS